MSERSRPPPPRTVRWSLPLVLVFLYLPLLAMIAASLYDQGSFSGRWYAELFLDQGLWTALGRSVSVAGASSAIAAVLGTLGALALDKWGFRARPALRSLSALSFALPELVLALALLGWFAMLGVPLSLWTVIAAHVTLALPFVILVVGARLKALDPAYDDAARDLGARERQIFFRVTLPLLGPSILTGFVLAFLISFDDFLVTFFTNGSGSDTLPVRLYTMMKTGMSPKVQALSSIMLLASLALIAALFRLRGTKDLSGGSADLTS